MTFQGDKMNYLRLSLAAGALTLALALPAFAGHMETPFTSPQPPPPTICEIGCSGVSADSATGITLSLVQSILALF
jgi:hypothetical protein